MTETETAYELEHEEWQRKPDAEPLPECETGSVEQMLEAAIEWSEKLNRKTTELACYVTLPLQLRGFNEQLESQTQLLRNILAKMETAHNCAAPKQPHWSECVQTAFCPACEEKIWIRVQMANTKPTDG